METTLADLAAAMKLALLERLPNHGFENLIDQRLQGLADDQDPSISALALRLQQKSAEDRIDLPTRLRQLREDRTLLEQTDREKSGGQDRAQR